METPDLVGETRINPAEPSGSLRILESKVNEIVRVLNEVLELLRKHD